MQYLKTRVGHVGLLLVTLLLLAGLPLVAYGQSGNPPLTPTPVKPPRIITPGTGLGAGVMPKVTPGPRPAINAHLRYFGGKVVSNVQVIQVLYGSGTYESQVQNTAAPSIASFYGGVTNSSYFDWLSEYNTNITAVGGGPGTNQVIGRGSFLQQVTITPAAVNNGSTIDDSNIQAEIKAQITAGHLPAPNANTYYALYFPHGKTITSSSGTSGVQFCAYHGTTTGPEFYYGVLPDFTTGGMASGCGGGTEFQNVTSVSSHELIETVTDAEVGISTVIGPPLAWYDSVNGEIGDICNAQQQAIVGGDGRTYTVQQEWSNLQNNCVVRGLTNTNDFSISANPSSRTVTAGQSTTSTISTVVTSGVTQAISLSANGLPSGATASFSQATILTGGSSTLTIATASTTPAGSYTITVTGTGNSATHTTTVTLTVNGTGGGGSIINGNFETGSLSGWTSAGTTSVTTNGPHSGSFAAMIGSTAPTNGDSSISQTFTAPTGATQLSFFYKVICPDTVTFDWAKATLRDNTAGTTVNVLAKTCTNTGTWVQTTATIRAGHSYTLTLLSHDDNHTGDATYTLYDDIATQ